MHIYSIMSQPAVTVPPGTTAREAAQRMRGRRISCVVVVDGPRLLGMFTESDLAKLVAEGHDLDRTTLRDVAAGPVVTIHATAQLQEAVARMKEHRVRRLPVVDGNDLKGIVTVTDLAFAMSRSERQALDAIRFRWEG